MNNYFWVQIMDAVYLLPMAFSKFGLHLCARSKRAKRYIVFDIVFKTSFADNQNLNPSQLLSEQISVAPIRFVVDQVLG